MKKNIYIKLFFILIFTLTTLSANTLSKQEFTILFKDNLTKKYTKQSFKLCGELCINSDDDIIYLDNAYKEYTLSKDSFNNIFSRHTYSLKNSKNLFKSGKKDEILPVVKSKEYIQELKLAFKKLNKVNDIYHRKISDNLYLLYVFDTPESMKYVTNIDIKRLKLENIKEIAVENLTKYYNNIGATIIHKDIKNSKGVYILSAKHNYEASIIVNKKFLIDKGIKIEGDIVIFIPARDAVMIVDSKDKVALKVASTISKKGYSELPYKISPYGYILKDKKIVKLVND